MKPSFGTSSADAFQTAARIWSLYIVLRVRAAQLRLNFLRSQLLRWVYRELELYRERWGLRSERRCTLDRIKMNPSFGPVLRLLFRQPLESGHFMR